SVLSFSPTHTVAFPFDFGLLLKRARMLPYYTTLLVICLQVSQITSINTSSDTCVLVKLFSQNSVMRRNQTKFFPTCVACTMELQTNKNQTFSHSSQPSTVNQSSGMMNSDSATTSS